MPVGPNAPTDKVVQRALVAGVDGCKGGWLCVAEAPDGNLRGLVSTMLRDLLESLRGLQVMAVDIPIGLPDHGARAADLEARALLGPRRNSVFPAPVRSVLRAQIYEEACERSFSACGQRLSVQQWGIVRKIREVDDLLSAEDSMRGVVKEVHPELCFFAWSGRPMAHPKKHRDGRAERRALIDRLWPRGWDAVRADLKRDHFGDDDLADAFAALWTARRIVAGQAWKVPAMPESDGLGLPMEMWA